MGVMKAFTKFKKEIKALASNKRGFFGALKGLSDSIGEIIVVGLMAGVGFLILTNFMSSEAVENGSRAETGINKTIGALMKIPNNLGLVIFIGMMAIILMLVIVIRNRTGGGKSTR